MIRIIVLLLSCVLQVRAVNRAFRIDDVEQGSNAGEQILNLLEQNKQVFYILDQQSRNEALESLRACVGAQGGYISAYAAKNTYLVVQPYNDSSTCSHIDAIKQQYDYLAQYKIAEEWRILEAAIEVNNVGHFDEVATDLQISESLRLKIPSLQKTILFNSQNDSVFDDASIWLQVQFPPKLFDVNTDEDRQSDLIKTQIIALPQFNHVPMQITQENDDSLIILVPAPQLSGVLKWLSEKSGVNYVSPLHIGQQHNHQISALVQSGAEYHKGDEQHVYPFWHHGLNGQGEIVGCGDSGLDWAHCMFADENNPIAISDFKMQMSGYEYINSQHRKVVYYRKRDWSGNGDTSGIGDEDGHGSHVVGTVLGDAKSYDDDENIDLRGVAYGAKVAFTDLASAYGGIAIPGNLETDYYNYHYKQGSRVQVDSWTSFSSGYTSMSASVDAFTWKNQDFLVIQSAGNRGGDHSLSTIYAPATAKNILVVGSTAGEEDDLLDQQILPVFIARIESEERELGRFKVQSAFFGDSLDKLQKKTLQLIDGHSFDACESLKNNDERVSGKVVLAQRGSCAFVTKAVNVQNAGAVGLIVSNNIDDEYIKMIPPQNFDTQQIQIPVASIPGRFGNVLQQALQNNNIINIIVEGQYDLSGMKTYENIAAYSSVGPTLDGRIKPDIVSLGTVRSASSRAENECSLEVRTGTSMAAPGVAAAAAIVRQYFNHAFYPYGVRGSGKSASPSGVLVKGMLVGGSEGLLGTALSEDNAFNGLALAPPPSHRQGFGRLNLASVLPLQNSSFHRLQVVDLASVKEGQIDTYCLQVKESSKISIVLTWYDPPSSTFFAFSNDGSSSLLINNLDLSVILSDSSHTKKYYGNGYIDSMNNIEKINLKTQRDGQLVIIVRGTDVPIGPQLYSLVVMGEFAGDLVSDQNPQINQQESCSSQLAQIMQGPSPITSNITPSFIVDSQGLPISCMLKKQGEQNEEWFQCDSPIQLSNLQDGSYEFCSQLFSGDGFMDCQNFRVDASAPVIQILKKPDSVSYDGIVEIEFQVTDESQVKCQYLLTYNKQEFPQEYNDCSSPLQFRNLKSGIYYLELQAIDEVDNAVSKQISWQILDQDEVIKAEIVKGPLRGTAASTVHFEFTANAIYEQEFDCKLIIVQNDSWKTIQSEKCSNSTDYQDLSEGLYRFVIQPIVQQNLNNIYYKSTFVDFRVDPRLQDFVLKPQFRIYPEYHTNRNAVVEIFSSFAEQPFDFSLECKLEYQQTQSEFQDCLNPFIMQNLQDGEYNLIVKVVNSDIQQQIRFRIDASPPYFNNLKINQNKVPMDQPNPIAISQKSVLIQLDSEDNGSNIVYQRCILQKISIDTNEVQTQEYAACFPAIKYYDNLQKGRYNFEIEASDSAGNVGTLTVPIVVDDTPPKTVITFQPPSQQRVSSNVRFAFTSEDTDTNISKSLCNIQYSDEQNMNLPSDIQQQGGVSVQLADTKTYEFKTSDGGVVEIGKQHECYSPVTYLGLRKGSYRFSVFSVDSAGNQGQFVQSDIFFVDESLRKTQFFVEDQFFYDQGPNDFKILSTAWYQSENFYKIAPIVLIALIVLIVGCFVLICFQNYQLSKELRIKNSQSSKQEARIVIRGSRKQTLAGEIDQTDKENRQTQQQVEEVQQVS